MQDHGLLTMQMQRLKELDLPVVVYQVRQQQAHPQRLQLSYMSTGL